MRYSIRRLRRKLPKAPIVLGCLEDVDPGALEKLRDSAKADFAAASLGEGLKLCIKATEMEGRVQIREELSGTITAA
jgi:hypothetical protein